MEINFEKITITVVSRQVCNTVYSTGLRSRRTDLRSRGTTNTLSSLLFFEKIFIPSLE